MTGTNGLLFLAALPLLVACETPSVAPMQDPAESGVHFLIPGAPGGGWDGTARGVGESLRRSGLVRRTSYENLSGGGGGRALAHLIATAPRQQSTLMIGSTPFLIQALRGRNPQTYRELTPICSVIGDYLSFVVRDDSMVRSWGDLVEGFDEHPRDFKFAGGSVLGGLDHLGTALAIEAAGGAPSEVRYVPYDTGGKAMAALLSGETAVLTTGIGEAVEAWRAGLVRILAVTSPERVAAISEVPTLRELGTDVEFVNWRGFFAAPDLKAERVEAWIDLVARLLETEEWESVRQRNGWVEIFHTGPGFAAFLGEQEQALAPLLARLEGAGER
ncbi:MAG: tripartite tricarboxylate transporter substrate-binding protein [Acidobacteriota bacterium]|nr:tripartite tricarboxylate transporter substrate-binding protein [Acidobacteriota bacterium]